MCIRDRAAQRIAVLVLIQLHAQFLAQRVQTRRTADAQARVAQGDDVLVRLGVKFVVDVADDLLQKVFQLSLIHI